MRLDLALLFSSVILLTGCSLTPTAVPIPEPGAAFQGVVHGGQQPVVGAHVFLLFRQCQHFRLWQKFPSRSWTISPD